MVKTIKYNKILFTQIKDYKDYYLSRNGKVLSTKVNKLKILKNNLGKVGYYTISLNNKTILIHRLLAQTFIPNILNKPHINHINGIKSDNRLENLEWVTHQENHIHRFRVLSHKGSNAGKFGKYHNSSKKVQQLDLDNNLIKVWDCARDAGRKLGFDGRLINAVCLDKRKTTKGFKWKYL